MRIQALVLKNFKSYQGKHVIGPFDDFTAIIGENGSGKSNCFDALCFVLGASANTMRCKKISNLIWMGTPKSYKASVKLTFDTNENVKSIKRKIVRNTSIYYINDEKKSNEEYKSFLQHIGFHPKLQNFVIFQGDIQMIAEMKPIELTKMVEELSGSIVYKQDYEDKEKRLHQIENEISFIEEKREVLSERKHDLKEEVNETNKWKQKETEMNHEKQICEDFQVYQMLESNKINSQKEIELKQNIQITQNNINNLNEVIETTNKTIKTFQKILRNDNKTLKRISSKIDQSQKELNNFKQLKTNNEEKIENIKQNISECQKNIERENKQSKEYQKTIKEFEQKYNNFIKNKSILINLQESINNIQSKIDQTQDSQSIDILQTTLLTENDLYQKTLKQIEQLNEQLRTITEEESKIGIIETPKEPNLENLKNELNSISKVIQNKQEELRKMDYIKHNTKREEEKNFMIQELHRKCKGVYGYVRDICRPIRSKYENAVNCGIGYYLDAIIVKDISTAQNCIEICKYSNLGNATFLPIENLRIKPQQHSKEDKLKDLKECIEYSTEYKTIIEYITNGIYFCESSNDAKRFSHMGKWKKIIDINGTIYKPNGIMIGGYTKRRTNFKTNPQKIKEEIEMNQSKYDEIRKIIRDQETKHFNDQLEYNQKICKLQMIHTKKANCEKLITNLNNKLNQHQTDIDNLKIEIESLKAKQSINSKQSESEKNEFFIKFKNENQTLFKQINLFTLEEILNNFNIFIEEENKIFEIRNQLNYILDSSAPEQLKQLKNELTMLKKQNQEIHSSIENTENEIHLTNEEMEKTKKEKEDIQNDLKQAQSQKSAFVKDLTKNEKQQNEFENTLNEISIKIYDSQKKLEEYVTKTNNNYTINDLYSKDFSHLPSYLCQLKSTAQINNIVKSFEERINKIKKYLEENTPNFQAIQSLDNIKSKIKSIDEELTIKRRELSQQHHYFTDVKKKRYQLFIETFHLIEKSVQEIYPKLTRNPLQPLGGNAFFSPIKPQCPFLDGIIYSVMPPLKRHRTLNYLSGGEQTLAVVSLIFALNQAKPSPCLILDEIDAALDKQNLMMLSTFLKTQSMKQQIIIVSHRNMVYSESQTLIGICHNIGNLSSLSYTLPLAQILNNDEDIEEDTNTQSINPIIPLNRHCVSLF